MIKYGQNLVQETLKTLKDSLQVLEYRTAYYQLLGGAFGQIHAPRNSFVVHSSPQSIFAKIFGQNKRVPLKTITEIISEELLRNLVEIGMVEVSGQTINSNYRIYPMNFRFFVLIPYQKTVIPPVYLGHDSLTFSRHLVFNSTPESVLDLGTGSGFQLFALPFQAPMLGIDLNPHAVEIARVNSDWNETHWISFEQIDMTKGLAGSFLENKSFDAIIGNPPVIPTPRNVSTRLQGSLHADGGVDGLAVVEKALPDLGSLLNKSGSVQLLLSSLGSKIKPRTEKLEALIAEAGLSGKLLGLKKIPVELDAYYRGKKDQREYERWLEFYRGQGAQCWYRLFVRLHPVKAGDQILDYVPVYRTDLTIPVNQTPITREMILSRISEYLFSSVPKGTTQEGFESYLGNVSTYIRRNLSNAFRKSALDYGYDLFETFPDVFGSVGQAIRFWGLCVRSDFEPKYAERTRW